MLRRREDEAVGIELASFFSRLELSHRPAQPIAGEWAGAPWLVEAGLHDGTSAPLVDRGPAGGGLEMSPKRQKGSARSTGRSTVNCLRPIKTNQDTNKLSHNPCPA